MVGAEKNLNDDSTGPRMVSVQVVRSRETYEGKQGFTYLRGLTGDTVGSKGICMTTLVIPDGARAKTHLHLGVETAVYIIDGHFEMFYGPELKQHVDFSTGEYVFIPADVAHLVMNRSGSPATALVAHSAPNDQERIVLLPELDTLIP